MGTRRESHGGIRPRLLRPTARLSGHHRRPYLRFRTRLYPLWIPSCRPFPPFRRGWPAPPLPDGERTRDLAPRLRAGLSRSAVRGDGRVRKEARAVPRGPPLSRSHDPSPSSASAERRPCCAILSPPGEEEWDVWSRLAGRDESSSTAAAPAVHGSGNPLSVMAGLVPAIHVLFLLGTLG